MSEKLPRYELVFDEEEMEGVYGVSLVKNPAIEILALQFSKNEICECNLSKDDISINLTNEILSKGEKIDLSDWELIDEKVVNNEGVYQIDLASTPKTSEGESEQDNEIFAVRYEYSPNSSTSKSRDFCRLMANSGLVFKKEDLVNSSANAGFGPNGASNYNIFLYKGGVNCQHFWSRKIYLKKNNKKMSVFEALKYIGGLDKEQASKAKFQDNPPEVNQVASASNNYWRLSSEKFNFKLSSEEKRILTSPVLLPEQDIYRNFGENDECNVFFSAATIEKLQQNFFKNQYQKNSTVEHKELIDGVFFFESWIVKNPKNDKASELGFDVPTGTWMMSMKVDNDEIWQDYIKTGKLKGFSIDSKLGVKKQKKTNEKMNFKSVRKAVLAKILLNSDLKEFKISDDLTVFAENLDQDMVVFDSENNPFANQEFSFEGKNYKTGENGEIISVEEAIEMADEEVPAEEVVTELVEKVEELLEDILSEVQLSKISKTLKSVKLKSAKRKVKFADEVVNEGGDLQAELDTANKRIEELEIENQELKAELATVKDEAVALSKQSRVEINLKNDKTKEVSLSNSPLSAIQNALRKK